MTTYVPLVGTIGATTNKIPLNSQPSNSLPGLEENSDSQTVKTFQERNTNGSLALVFLERVFLLSRNTINNPIVFKTLIPDNTTKTWTRAMIMETTINLHKNNHKNSEDPTKIPNCLILIEKTQKIYEQWELLEQGIRQSSFRLKEIQEESTRIVVALSRALFYINDFLLPNHDPESLKKQEEYIEFTNTPTHSKEIIRSKARGIFVLFWLENNYNRNSQIKFPYEQQLGNIILDVLLYLRTNQPERMNEILLLLNSVEINEAIYGPFRPQKNTGHLRKNDSYSEYVDFVTRLVNDYSTHVRQLSSSERHSYTEAQTKSHKLRTIILNLLLEHLFTDTLEKKEVDNIPKFVGTSRPIDPDLITLHPNVIPLKRKVQETLPPASPVPSSPDSQKTATPSTSPTSRTTESSPSSPNSPNPRLNAFEISRLKPESDDELAQNPNKVYPPDRQNAHELDIQQGWSNQNLAPSESWKPLSFRTSIATLNSIINFDATNSISNRLILGVKPIYNESDDSDYIKSDYYKKKIDNYSSQITCFVTAVCFTANQDFSPLFIPREKDRTEYTTRINKLSGGLSYEEDVLYSKKSLALGKKDPVTEVLASNISKSTRPFDSLDCGYHIFGRKRQSRKLLIPEHGNISIVTYIGIAWHNSYGRRWYFMQTAIEEYKSESHGSVGDYEENKHRNVASKSQKILDYLIGVADINRRKDLVDFMYHPKIKKLSFSSLYKMIFNDPQSVKWQQDLLNEILPSYSFY